MKKIKWARIYDYVKALRDNATQAADNYLVLVDRLWPRGISRAEVPLDCWAKDITPTTTLRQQYHKGMIDYSEFAKRYNKELENNPQFADFIAILRREAEMKDVMLLYASKTPEQSHIPTLRRHIESALGM
jgi:uncharacterized protein YeaO (DUF488 family)